MVLGFFGRVLGYFITLPSQNVNGSVTNKANLRRFSILSVFGDLIMWYICGSLGTLTRDKCAKPLEARGEAASVIYKLQLCFPWLVSKTLRTLLKMILLKGWYYPMTVNTPQDPYVGGSEGTLTMWYSAFCIFKNTFYVCHKLLPLKQNKLKYELFFFYCLF